MSIIERILAKVAKLSINSRTRNHVENLVMQAYEAGRRDMIKDITISLTDDMRDETEHSDHADALEFIAANY